MGTPTDNKVQACGITYADTPHTDTHTHIHACAHTHFAVPITTGL